MTTIFAYRHIWTILYTSTYKNTDDLLLNYSWATLFNRKPFWAQAFLMGLDSIFACLLSIFYHALVPHSLGFRAATTNFLAWLAKLGCRLLICNSSNQWHEKKQRSTIYCIHDTLGRPVLNNNTVAEKSTIKILPSQQFVDPWRKFSIHAWKSTRREQ